MLIQFIQFVVNIHQHQHQPTQVRSRVLGQHTPSLIKQDEEEQEQEDEQEEQEEEQAEQEEEREVDDDGDEKS